MLGGDSHLLLAPQNPAYEVQAEGNRDGPLGELGGPRAGQWDPGMRGQAPGHGDSTEGPPQGPWLPSRPVRILPQERPADHVLNLVFNNKCFEDLVSVRESQRECKGGNRASQGRAGRDLFPECS